MLHELLLALSGHPGSIFVKRHDGEIQVVGELPFIHPTEVCLLNRLCRLATHYNQFVAFIRRYGHGPGKVAVEGLHGLYLKALCQGLDKVLDPYRLSLLELERQLLADPHLTATHVQTALEQYQILFPAVSLMLEQIIQHKAHGCYILEIVHKAAVNGIPIVKQAFHRILHVCHSVLYKQLAAWMLYGMLLDQYDEFFVQRVRKEVTAGGPVQVEDDELGLGGVTGKQLQQILEISEGLPCSSTYEQFGIYAEKLPSYIPSRVAEKILFVGESVQMFEKDIHGAKHKIKGSVLGGKEDQFAKDLHALSQDQVFDLMDFERIVDKIRAHVAEQLWRLIVEEADLVGHMRIMKDFFLLGRGELFLAFIDQAQSLLRPVPTGTTEHDINMAFQHAARNVLFEDETLLQRFRLTVDTGTTFTGTETKKEPKALQQQRKGVSGEPATQGITESGWNLLRLNYNVPWPLHILFTKGILDRYNGLLHFLLYVKRIQLELQQIWALQMQRKHIGCKDTSSAKWWLRNHMAFLIDNLQYYLQVDVIESQFSLLLDKIEATRDFEAIRLAHDTFLTSLLSQSFLLMKPISHCLSEILELCHAFCGLVSQSEVSLTEREHSHLDDITKNFQRQSNLLFKILSSVRNHQASPHLAQLLLRIDYNKYFSLAGGQLGSYQTVVVDSSV